MWSLLKEHKVDRVILFSTQFMDEADILADFDIGKQEKTYVTRNTGNESEMEQVFCSLPEMRKAVSDAALWRQQIYAVAILRFLKLRCERRALLCFLTPCNLNNFC